MRRRAPPTRPQSPPSPTPQKVTRPRNQSLLRQAESPKQRVDIAIIVETWLGESAIPPTSAILSEYNPNKYPDNSRWEEELRRDTS